MMLIRDIKQKLLAFRGKENMAKFDSSSTILTSYDELMCWYQDDPDSPSVEMILDDAEYIIPDTLHWLVDMIEDYGLTFKHLEIDFELLNSHYKWVSTDKIPKKLPSWINLKNKTVVSHGSSWFEDSDGVWRKTQDVPF